MPKMPKTDTTPDGPYHLYEDAGGVIHSCEGGRCADGWSGQQTYVVWTKCQKDVPSDRSFKSWEGPTCMDCALALDQEKLEMMGAA